MDFTHKVVCTDKRGFCHEVTKGNKIMYSAVRQKSVDTLNYRYNLYSTLALNYVNDLIDGKSYEYIFEYESTKLMEANFVRKFLEFSQEEIVINLSDNDFVTVIKNHIKHMNVRLIQDKLWEANSTNQLANYKNICQLSAIRSVITVLSDVVLIMGFYETDSTVIPIQF